MKWIALLLQLVSFRSSLLESRALLENARNVAEKGKRAALFSAFFLLALVYFLVGSILAVVEVGLQVDRGNGLHFSGLLGASFALMLIAAVIVGGGALASRSSKAPPEPPSREPDLRALLEEALVTFVSQLTSKLKEKPQGKNESRG